MEMILEASPRAEKGKQLKELRARGVLPGIVYGPKEAATPLALSRAVFEKLFAKAGESTVITLKGLGSDKEVLVYEVEHDPVSGHAIHVDFYAIEAGKTIRVHVPIEFVGEAPVLKGEATLTKVLHEIEVECMPRNLPQHLTVDVTSLAAIGDAIHVRDLAPIAGVEILAEADDVVVVANAVVEEVEEAAPVDMAAIEVEQKGKKEEGEAAAE
jgi:large subunit ribosomal protein L25